MATNFPNGVDNFPTHTDNNSEKINAAHFNNVQDGLKAVQQEVINNRETNATVGDLSNLTTTDKDSVVDAINEVKSTSIPTSEKGATSGVATLDGSGKIPSVQIPTLSYIPTSEKGSNNGVATLDGTGKVPTTQIPNSNDLVKIAEVTLGANAATIDFTAIPQTYKNLVIKGMVRTTAGTPTDFVNIRFNGNSTGVYNYHYVIGNANTVTDAESMNQTSIIIGRCTGNSGVTAGFFTPIELIIQDYASTTKAKTILFQTLAFYGTNANTMYSNVGGGFSSLLTAVSSVNLFNPNQWLAGTTLTLYGIK